MRLRVAFCVVHCPVTFSSQPRASVLRRVLAARSVTVRRRGELESNFNDGTVTNRTAREGTLFDIKREV